MFNQHMSIKKIWSISGTIHKIRRCIFLPPSLFPMSADVYFFPSANLKDILTLTSIQIADIFYGRPLLRNAVILLYRMMPYDVLR